MNRKQQGFTLIELLVVIAIIGILSSVVLASLNSARQKSRDARVVSDIKQLQLALELYFDDNGEYPCGNEGVSTANCFAATDGSGIAPDYIAAIPTHPISSEAYQYEAFDDSTGADLCVDADTCLYYQLGGVLESNTHTALNADRDWDPAAGGIDGDSDAANCGVGAGTDTCYDVTP